MVRIPPGTAATSARARIPWILFASLSSASVGDDKFSSDQSLIEATGTKLGMPLTVPWPPHCIQGVRSAIRPSSKMNGNFRVSFIVVSSEIRAWRRISFPILPPHLLVISAAVQMVRVVEKLETHVNFTPHKLVVFFIIALMTSEDISWPPALEGKLYSNRGICHFVSNDTCSALWKTWAYWWCFANINIILNDLVHVCVQTRGIIGR